jgi:hypothetical protein
MKASAHLDPESIELHAQGQGAAAEHLAVCAACRERVAHARARRRLVSELQAPHLDEWAFARVERTLFAAKPARSLWRWALPGFAVAAAAAALVLVWRRPSAPAARPAVAAAQTPPPLAHPRAPRVSAAVTFIEGTAEREASGTWTELDPALALDEGAHVRTGEGRLGVQVAAGRGVTLAPHSELRWTELTQKGVRLELAAGRVSSVVAPLSADEAFSVKAGPWYVRVVGTAFAVTRDADSLQVDVSHGTVAVSTAVDGPALRVPGPARLEARDGTPVSALSATSLTVDAAARLAADPDWKWAPGPGDGAIRLDIGDLPAGATVSLAEGGWGPAPVSAWLMPGSYGIRARVAGEPERVGTVSLVPGSERQRFTLHRAVNAIHRPPPVPPKVVAGLVAVERQHHRELAYCSEHALKRNPTIVGRMTLAFTLTPEGAVLDAQTGAEDGSSLPEELAACILEGARGWTFPEGSPATFELPLNLRAH